MLQRDLSPALWSFDVLFPSESVVVSDVNSECTGSAWSRQLPTQPGDDRKRPFSVTFLALHNQYIAVRHTTTNISHLNNMTSSNLSIDETLATIEVMRCQEEVGYTVSDYLSQLPASGTFEAPVDAQCRMVMQKWCKDIAQYCSYSPETVEIAMNCLDRFMATRDGYSILLDRSEFQLAVMTALYSAVKVHEHEAMDPRLVSSLSQGAHSAEAVEAMEVRMLKAVQWRVNPPTAMAFVRNILDLIPEHLLEADERQAVIDLTKFQVELALEQYEFCMMPASSIAMASLLNAVESVSSNDMFVDDFEPSACNVARVDVHALRSIRIHLYESINGVEPMDVQFTCDSTGSESTKCGQETHGASQPIGTSPRSVSI